MITRATGKISLHKLLNDYFTGCLDFKLLKGLYIVYFFVSEF